jgi:hypothetical protein
LEALLLSGLMGAVGQSVRAIVGLKGLADDRADPNVTNPEAFSPTRLVVSLIIGFVAGVAAGLTIGLDKIAAVSPSDTKLLVSLMAAGYAGADFIEGFMATYLPGQGSGGSAGTTTKTQSTTTTTPTTTPAGATPAPALASTQPPPPQPGAGNVRAACEAEWDAHKSDCSGFVIAVAARLSAVIQGDANAIAQALGAGGVWQKLADGVAAAAAAQAGKFVVGGLVGSAQAVPDAHGHVVVVVDGPLNRGKYPSAYWGRLGGVGAKDQTINWAWTAADRDKVIYAAYEP